MIKHKKYLLLIFLSLLLVSFSTIKTSTPAYAAAAAGASCQYGCSSIGCITCIFTITLNHQLIDQHTTLKFQQHRIFLLEELYRNNILPALQRMTQQFTAVMLHQTFIIGKFFDSKHQLETQRIFKR